MRAANKEAEEGEREKQKMERENVNGKEINSMYQPPMPVSQSCFWRVLLSRIHRIIFC